MACLLSDGRGLECRESIGGIRNVYFANDNTLGNYTITSSELTDVSGTATIFKYALIPQSSGFDEAITVSEENGTVFFEQTLSLALPNVNKTQLQVLKVLTEGRFQVFVEDNNLDANGNGKVFLAGAFNGMTVTGGNVGKGQAFGDMNGYSLTLVGREKDAAVIVEPSTTAGDPFADFTTITVDDGS